MRQDPRHLLPPYPCLHVSTAIGDNPNFTRDNISPPLGEWTSVVVSQLKSTFSIYINGTDPSSVENPEPKEFSNVKVFASDPWWDAQLGSIFSLTIKTK